MVSTRTKNPNWHRDELILALDFYLRHRTTQPGKHSAEVRDLSNSLQHLAGQLGQSGLATYRNVNSVYMKLMNFRALDPMHTQAGKVGLTRIGKADRQVWESYHGDPGRCAEVAAAILHAATSTEIMDLTNDVDDEIDEAMEADEGRLLTRIHLHRERNRKIVRAKKEAVLKRIGKLACEACGFDFSVSFGERGQGFIECHHVKPLHQAPSGKTRLADLALVCANCHRMIHLRRPWLSMEELRHLIACRQPGDPTSSLGLRRD